MKARKKEKTCVSVCVCVCVCVCVSSPGVCHGVVCTQQFILVGDDVCACTTQSVKARKREHTCVCVSSPGVCHGVVCTQQPTWATMGDDARVCGFTSFISSISTALSEHPALTQPVLRPQVTTLPPSWSLSTGSRSVRAMRLRHHLTAPDYLCATLMCLTLTDVQLRHARLWTTNRPADCHPDPPSADDPDALTWTWNSSHSALCTVGERGCTGGCGERRHRGWKL